MLQKIYCQYSNVLPFQKAWQVKVISNQWSWHFSAGIITFGIFRAREVQVTSHKRKTVPNIFFIEYVCKYHNLRTNFFFVLQDTETTVLQLKLECLTNIYTFFPRIYMYKNCSIAPMWGHLISEGLRVPNLRWYEIYWNQVSPHRSKHVSTEGNDKKYTVVTKYLYRKVTRHTETMWWDLISEGLRVPNPRWNDIYWNQVSPHSLSCSQ